MTQWQQPPESCMEPPDIFLVHGAGCRAWSPHADSVRVLGTWPLPVIGSACKGCRAQLTCSRSFSSIWLSVSSWSRWLRYTRVSCMVLYRASVSVSFIVSRTMFPFSSSTTMTCKCVKKVLQHHQHLMRGLILCKR